MMTVSLTPAFIHPLFNKRAIAVTETGADIFGKGKIGLPAATIQIIIENAADTARLITMLQIEILITPVLIARIIALIMRITGRLEIMMKRICRWLISKNRR